MSGTPIDIPVEVDVDSAGMSRAMTLLAVKVEEINRLVTKLGLSGKQGIEGFNAELGQTLGLVNAQIGRLEAFQRSMREQGRAPIRGVADDQAFARTTRAASIYAQTLNNAENAAQGLQARINRIDKQMTEGGNQGNLASRNSLSRRMGLEQAQKDLVAIERQLQRTQEQAARTGRAFAGPQGQVTSARSALEQAVLNPQVTNSTFQGQLRDLRTAQAVYQQEVNAARLDIIRTARSDRASGGANVPGQTAQAYRERDQLMTAEARKQTDIDRAYAARQKEIEAQVNSAYAQRKHQVNELNDLENEGLRQTEAINRRAAREATATQSAGGRLAPTQARRETQAELAAMTSLEEVEVRRVASNLELDRLMARATRAQGEEKVLLAEQVRLEQVRNNVIRERQGQLERQNAQQSRPSRLGTAFQNTAAYGGAGMAQFAAFSAVQGSLQFVAEFDDKLHQLQAVAGATDAELVTMTSAITQVGRSSRFSLIDLAGMAEKLAQVGVSAGDMGRVLSSVSRLAASSGSTPQEAVDLVTASLGAFQLGGNEAARVADLITTALNRTRLTVQQAGQAIQYVGTAAYEQNISLEQLMATSAAIAQSGVRAGSTIGTGMRQFLIGLQEPTRKMRDEMERLHISMSQLDVTTRGLPAVLETLDHAGFGTAQAFGALQTRAAAFYLAARNNLPLINDLQQQMVLEGAAAEGNEHAMSSLAGEWQRFKNIVGGTLALDAAGWFTNIKTVIDLAISGMERYKALREGLNSGQAASGASSDAWRLLNHGFEAASSLSIYGQLAHLNNIMTNLRERFGNGTAAVERFTTSMHEAETRTAEHTDKITTLDHEIGRLIERQPELTGNLAETTSETVTLTTRISGLGEAFANTTGGVGGLIQAMRTLRNEERGLAVEAMAGEAVAAQGVRRAQTGVRNNSAAALLSQGYMLTDRERAALQPGALDSARGDEAGQRRVLANLGVIRQIAERLAVAAPAMADLARSTVTSHSAQAGATSRLRVIDQATNEYNVPRTEFGSLISNQLENVEHGLPALQTAARGAAQATAARALEQQLNATSSEIARRLRPGDRGPNADWLRQQSAPGGRIASLRQQIAAILTPTRSEDAEANRASHRADHDAQHPLITHADLIAGARALLGNTVRVGRGQDTAAHEDALHARGVTPATGRTSAHVIGVAQDFPTGPVSQARGDQMAAELEAYYRSRGMPVNVRYENGHGRNQGTGAHLHAGVARGTRHSANADTDGSQREDANIVATERGLVTEAERDLRDRVRDMGKVTSRAMFKAAVTSTRQAETVWADRLRNATEHELARQGIDPHSEAWSQRMAEVESTIRQRQEELSQSIFDATVHNVDRQMTQIQHAYDRAVQPAQAEVSRIQGQISGLSYASLDGQVPDFVTTLAQRRQARAEENVANVQSNAMGRSITDQQRTIDQFRIDTAGLAEGSAQAETAATKIQDLTTAMQGLVDQKEALDAALGANGLLPPSLRQGLNQAISAFRDTNHLGESFHQTVLMNMTSGLQSLHDSFKQLFTDLFSGTKTIAQAFGDMARSIMSSLAAMAAQFVANQIFSKILGLISPSNTGGWFQGGGGALGSQNFSDVVWPGRFNGGAVSGAYNGRYITDGFPGRDSVNMMLAKGEYVMSKAAVDNVGVDFMSRINRQGARALDGLRPGMIMPRPAHQELKVYVVSPEQKPTMGPTDVLVTIANDIASGGQTAKLIKHVSQGG